jgi:uncharacterized circularly permuted ATP-grasp superfamily protein
VKQLGAGIERVGDLFDEYLVGPGWDEMFEAEGRPRPCYQALHRALETLSRTEMAERSTVRDRTSRAQGVTFSFGGEERPFPVDLVPRIIPADEWATVEAGVIQRIRALEAFLADVYGEGLVFKDGIVSRRLAVTSPNFVPHAGPVVGSNGVRVHVAGIDLVRGHGGRYLVLEDNLRVPSGISYVIENRRVMTRLFPELFGSHRVRPVDSYPAELLDALRAAAPAGVDDPVVAVLTPGVANAAYFEHSFLARQMGVELVEGRDLVCRENVVSILTTEGERHVDVIYRRVDDEFLDPLAFRPDSLLGCPGIVNAARAGRVSIANGVGNGVADDKALYPHIPALIEYYLGAKPLLDSVPTFQLEDTDHLQQALGLMDQLVWKPVAASGGHGIVIGPRAADEELFRLRTAVEEDPRAWIAQEVVPLSTSPTYVGGNLEPRHVDLRPFAVNRGDRVWVVPGGLTRVAMARGRLVVNSSQGGGSKDTWVLADDKELDPPGDTLVAAMDLALAPDPPGSGAAEGPGHRPPPQPGPSWDAGRQQQQQQQQEQGPC